MNRNATHTSTDKPEGNNLKGCALLSAQPTIFILPPCPSLRQPFRPIMASKNPVIGGEAKQSLNISVKDNANRSINASTSSRQGTPPLPSLRAKRSNPNLKKNNAVPSSNPTTKEPNNMKCVAPHPPSEPTCRAFHTMALSGLLTLAFIAPATAADFPGSLKGATITDAQTTNRPPVAAFTYTVDGDTVTLDAGGSSDPDGSITKYKWDFGKGNTAEGAKTTYVANPTETVSITLTVVDDKTGVGMSQKMITPAASTLTDDFSIDPNLNYTTITGAMTVTNGTAHGKQWAQTRVYRKSPLSSSDHYVEADVQYLGGYDSGGVLARVNPATNSCYLAYFSAGKIVLAKFNGSSQRWLNEFNGRFPAGIHKVRIEITGSEIKVYVNNIIQVYTSDTTYLDGKNIGILLYRDMDNSDITVDNLISSIK